jgi:tetratricopeptide (TPR) repeat protein
MSCCDMRRFLRVAALLVLAGCVRRVVPPTQVLERANEAASQPSADAHTLALAGWHALLISGDTQQAVTAFDKALSQSNAEPFALYGQMMLSLRSASPQRALGSALDLIERNPKHPLSATAARIALELAGTAESTDQTIVDRAPPLLEAGVLPETAQLLRASLTTIFMARNDLTRHAQLISDLGSPTAATLVGPFSPWHTLAAGERTEPEKSGSLEALGQGPFGALQTRIIRFADGRFSLGGEPTTGDVYLFAVDATVAEGGEFWVRTVSSMDHVVSIDGTTLIERLTWLRPAPTLLTRAVSLPAGTHRLMVRMTKEDAQGFLNVALVRANGKPSNISYKPASGPAPSWSGVKPTDEAEEALAKNGAQAVYDALLDEAGEALARFIAAKDTLGRHRDGAWRMINALPSTVNAPMVEVLRAELALQDRTMVAKVARGRATRDLEAALAKDPGFTAARMLTAQLALDDGRQLDALGIVKSARATAGAVLSAPLLQLQARVELALGLEAQASVTAREAEKVSPGACDALILQYDVARRRDAIADADSLLAKATHCPAALARSAEHQRARGHLAEAVSAWRQLLDRDESQVVIAISLVKLLIAQEKYDDAVTVLQAVRAQWPRHAGLAKHLADVFELAGRTQEALATREAALLLDGSDLSLRRAVSRTKTGHELLAESAISTHDALQAYEAAPGNEEANAAFLLDAAAIRAYPDGTQVDRIHIIEKALDQQGVQEIAEVNLPEGAQVLKLRTLKSDGSVQEPEGIEGKETVSMPGVQVGDLVEYEYLLAHPPRGPGQPGFTSSSFYFQVAGQPNNWSTYTVIAPKGAGLKVDAHNMDSPGPKVVGDEEVYFHDERRVRPYIPEPGGPVSGNEFLPFVSVGAGQTGNEGLVTAYSDAFLDKGLITHEVEAFAHTAAAQKVGLEAVQAVYSAVMSKLSGRDAGLSFPAAASVSQDRGSRTWLLKSALMALGFDARLVAVRAFTSDPAPYLFPAEAVLPYVCVRVTLPGLSPIWLDPLVRYAPFGELPEFAMGEREAFVFPEPGKPLEKTKTPAALNRPGKTVKLSLSLGEDGVLTGSGVETYTGFDAAQLAEGLESLSVDQRNQALQQALSRYFGGADMAGIEVDAKREVGATVKVSYTFAAQRFGRLEGENRMIITSLTYPALLGRRYLQLSHRRTPLFLGSTESTHTTTTLTLPQGWALNEPVGKVELAGPVGTFNRSEVQRENVVTVDERLLVPQSRIAPAKYEAFGQFAGEVDLVQGRDLLVEKR